jgi:hypothetical protein
MNPTFEEFMSFLMENSCIKEFDLEFERQSPGYHLDANLWDILGGDEYFQEGRTPDKVSIEESMLAERVSVPFLLRKFDTSGNLIEETKMKMTAGMIGVS